MPQIRAGSVYGDWTTIGEYIPKSRSVLCRCVCGKEKGVKSYSLSSGDSTGCGCRSRVKRREARISNGDFTDIVGQKFGQRMVLAWSDRAGYVKAQCDCGKVDEVFAPTLRSGRSMSCGGCGLMVKAYKKSMLEKYGVDHPLHLDEFKKKAQETSLKKYGVENPAQSKTVQNKIKKTMRSRHGVDNALKMSGVQQAGVAASHSPEAKAKRIESSMAHYGVSHPMKAQVVVDQIKSTSIERYGVTNWSKTEEAKRAFSLKNPMKDPEVRQRFYDSLQAKYGVSRLTELEAFKKAVKYNIEDKSLRQHLFDNEIDHVQYDAVRKVYRDQGKEAALDYIERSKSERLSSLELFFSRQVISLEKFDKKVLKDKGWRPDFKLSDELFVNVDGLITHCEYFRDQSHHSKVRKDFEAEGKRILQFYEDEIRNRPLVVRSMIENAIGKSIKVQARKCDVVPIRMGIAAGLLNEWHLMGRGAPSMCLALAQKDGEIICVLTYRKKGDDIEISRFGSKLGTVVVGGFGKLLSALKKLVPGKRIVSFCDMRYATGRSYTALGFKKKSEHISFCWTNGRERFNRRYCVASPDKSQEEVAKEKKVIRLFDAGQVCYVLEPSV